MITYTAKEMLGITKECKKRSYQKGYRAGVKKLDKDMKREMNEWHKHEQTGKESVMDFVKKNGGVLMRQTGIKKGGDIK
jgi:hypothetical protein